MSDIDDELFALAGGDDDGEVEEGEASSVAASSPNSLGSDAMDESDSDRDDDMPSKDSDVPYPLEGKYIDSKDRSYINSLPQLERERILGERAEEQSKAQFNAELARRAKGLEKTSALDRKRKADSDEPEDSQRKSSRQVKKGKTNDKLEAYKREREQRGQQRQRQDDDRRNGRRRSSSADRHAGSDLDAEGESEVEYYEEKVKREEPARIEHFEHVRVSRGLFGQVCFYPGFEEAMTGTYARVGTGQDSQRRTLYKMAQIKGFTTGRPYVFEGKDGQRFGTDQYIIAQHGTVKKEYNFSYLSNQRFTEAEFNTYKQSLAETNSKFPVESTLKKKWEDMKALQDRFWTDADINSRIEKSRKYEHLLSSKGSADSGPRIATQAELNAKRIADLNKKNRIEDSERVRKALIEERRRDMQDRKRREREHLKQKAEEEAKKKAEEEKAAKTLDELFEGDSRAGTPRAGTPKPGEKKKELKKGLPTFRKPKMDDDIIANMDFGVEIEI